MDQKKKKIYAKIRLIVAKNGLSIENNSQKVKEKNSRCF